MEEQKLRRLMSDFLQFLCKNTSAYILKGGTALMLCYGLDRFSEDIVLDGKGSAIIDLVDLYCKHNSYEYIIDENTETLKRCMIHYGGNKPLKIEVSCRKKHININEYVKINGINVYTIERLAAMKCTAYASFGKIRDLYDLSFICCNYYEGFSRQTKNFIFDAVSAKGIEQYYYIINNQTDDLINKEKLSAMFLSAIEKIGLRLDNEERDMLNN